MNHKWRNRALWLLIVGVSLSVLKQVSDLAGYPIPDPSLAAATDIATTVINALAILGILSDPPQAAQKDDKSQSL